MSAFLTLDRPICNHDPKDPKPGCPGCEAWKNNAQYRLMIQRIPGGVAGGRLERTGRRMDRFITGVWWWLKRVARFGRAAAVHMAHGMPNVAPEERERRLAICKKCPALNDKTECQFCTCPMEKKTWWAKEKCPHPAGDKWAGAVEPEI